MLEWRFVLFKLVEQVYKVRFEYKSTDERAVNTSWSCVVYLITIHLLNFIYDIKDKEIRV